MSFQVCRIGGVSQIDSIPVAVIKNYPLEKRDYKPYAQANLCLDGENLLLRMWAFEVIPPAGSEMRAVFYLFPDKPETALSVSVTPQGACSLTLLAEGKERALTPPEGFQLHPFNGEDLQGVYWGGLLLLPRTWLESLTGRISLREGDSFAGNFYKVCPGPAQAHQGSFFPANFIGDPYSRASMGDCLVVSY